MNWRIFAAADFFKSQTGKFQTAAVLFEYYAVLGNPFCLLNSFRRNRSIIRQLTERTEIFAVQQCMTEHRVEIDNIKTVIRLCF